MASGSSPPGPFPVNPCEVPYIVHWEEFINKCFLSQFRNTSPSVAFEALSSLKAVLLHVQRAAPSLQRLAAAMAGAVPGRRGPPPCSLLLLTVLGKEAGRNWEGVTLGLQEQPPTLEPALWTADCHHLGSGPLFYTSSLCSQVPRAAPSCPGLKAPLGILGTGRARGR